MKRRNRKRLENYPLFFEELTRDRDRGAESTKKPTTPERGASLSERDVAKLSDDLRRPMKNPPVDSNPLQ